MKVRNRVCERAYAHVWSLILIRKKSYSTITQRIPKSIRIKRLKETAQNTDRIDTKPSGHLRKSPEKPDDFRLRQIFPGTTRP